MRNLIRLAAVAAAAAVFVHSLYVLGWHARDGEHVARGVLHAAAGAVLLAATLRAWRTDQPTNPVMIAAVGLLVVISSVVGMVF